MTYKVIQQWHFKQDFHAKTATKVSNLVYKVQNTHYKNTQVLKNRLLIWQIINYVIAGQISNKFHILKW